MEGGGGIGSRDLRVGPHTAMRAPAVMSSSAEKKAGKPRGRPPKARPEGEGRSRSQLALLGGRSAVKAFTPHVLLINQGEDITAKIIQLSELHAKSICILAANGPVSTVTLRLSSHSDGFDNAVYQGQFEIVSLKGSYLLSDEAGLLNCTGGLSILVSAPCGSIFGGCVGGPLIAANPVQVIAGSFNHRVSEGKNEAKNSGSQLAELNVPWELEDASYHANAVADESFSSLPHFGWSGLEDIKPAHHGIDLTNG